MCSEGSKPYTRIYLSTSSANLWNPQDSSCTFILPRPIKACEVGLEFICIDGGIVNIIEPERAVYNGHEMTLPVGSYTSISNLLWCLTKYDNSVSFSHVGNTLRFKATGDTPVSLSISAHLANILGLPSSTLRPGTFTIQPNIFQDIPYRGGSTWLASDFIVMCPKSGSFTP